MAPMPRTIRAFIMLVVVCGFAQAQPFGAHSDQERLLVSELHRFMRFYWDAVTAVAGRK